jgi:hypothetical protein
MLRSIGIAALLLSLSGTAFAKSEHCKTVWFFFEDCQAIKHNPHTAIAPEFNGASAVGAVTLLAGGLAIFLGRRRSRLSA